MVFKKKVKPVKVDDIEELEEIAPDYKAQLDKLVHKSALLGPKLSPKNRIELNEEIQKLTELICPKVKLEDIKVKPKEVVSYSIERTGNFEATLTKITTLEDKVISKEVIKKDVKGLCVRSLTKILERL